MSDFDSDRCAEQYDRVLREDQLWTNPRRRDRLARAIYGRGGAALIQAMLRTVRVVE